jgi:hypothetical protein
VLATAAGKGSGLRIASPRYPRRAPASAVSSSRWATTAMMASQGAGHCQSTPPFLRLGVTSTTRCFVTGCSLCVLMSAIPQRTFSSGM